MSDAYLDWSRHQVGPPRPCRECGRPAITRDQTGKPCHLVCAQAAVDRAKAAAKARARKVAEAYGTAPGEVSAE